jgi:transposase-like protein
MVGWFYSSPSAYKNLTELTKLQLLIRKQHTHIIAYAVGFNSYRRDITSQIRVLYQHTQTEQVKMLPNQ